jgi:hypothetical protein
LLVLLYAQPVARISQLPRTAVHIGAEGVRLRIANQDLPLPEPLGGLVVQLADTADSTTPWLFPGRRPGRPLTAKWLRARLRAVGIRQPGRVAALDDLASEIPAPVLADLTGYDPRFLAKRAATLATDWAGYAALRTGDVTGTGY